MDKMKKVEEEKYSPSELEKFKQEAYEKGMEEAWKIAGLIVKSEREGGIDKDLLEFAFMNKIHNIWDSFTIQQAKEIIEKNFPEKLNPPSLKVGDVVEKDGIRGVVLDIDFDENFISIWDENGISESWSIEKVTKIDAHCDLKPILEFIGKR